MNSSEADLAHIAVVGTGYVGLVTGTCLADLGHHVTCNDVNPQRIEALAAGQVPFYEPGLEAIIQRTVSAGRLRFTTDLRQALQGAAFAIVAVGTPSDAAGAADLTALHKVVDGLAAAAPKGLVAIIRSTVPPGTGDGVQRRLRDAGRPDLQVVNAPEFLAEGTAVKDFQEPDRLVFGGDAKAAQEVAKLWEGIRPVAKRHLVDRATAEVAKYAANTFLAARVSLINEVANLCDAVGADVRAISAIVGEDTRIGAKFLRPGIGYGGSCFPKDVQALAFTARSLGLNLAVAEAAETTNNAQWQRVHAKALKALGGSAQGKAVAILGIAFKPETDDTRYAPGLRLAKALVEGGAKVRMHDPIAKVPHDLVQQGVTQSNGPDQAIAGSDVVVLATEWKQYNALDWPALAKKAGRPVLVDGRNALPWEALVKAGWSVEGIGAHPPRLTVTP